MCKVCQRIVPNLTQENIRGLESQDCAFCMINNFNENCWTILDLVKKVGVNNICEVYKDRCDIELFKKNLIERVG